MVKLMQYRSTYKSEQDTEDTIQDIFDGKNYTRLKDEYVTIGGVQQGHKFFSNDHDIAHGLSLDGFCPFKRRNQTCWPLLLFNYNLPPDIRFHLCHLLCAGVIPGHQKPKDADSFAYPIILELLELLSGVATFDIERNEIFALCAYLIVVFGNIPAISMIMRMKGHNVTHDQFLEQARHVQLTPTDSEEQRHSKACGIKGIPVLSHLPSLFFPSSFPFDFMHLVWENLIPNLILLWTGKFKGLDEGRETYHLLPGVWEAIGKLPRVLDPQFRPHMQLPDLIMCYASQKKHITNILSNLSSYSSNAFNLR
jgi:hypothetical protein